MKMNTILYGRHYMMVASRIYEECFTCNILSCNGSVKARICIYSNGTTDLYEFNGIKYGLNDIDVSVLYNFVKDKINQKKVEEYLDKCCKNKQYANDKYLRLEEESIINPKPNVDYEELVDELDYIVFLKSFCYVNPKKYKEIAEKVTYSRMYDNICATKEMLIKSGCDAFTSMIHSCNESLLVVKERLSSLTNK